MCITRAREIFSSGRPIPEVKLNFIYTGKIMLDHETRKELFDVIKEFIRRQCRLQKQIDFFAEYIDKIFINQIVSFGANDKTSVTVQTKIRLDAIEQNNYNSIDDLLGENLLSIELNFHEDVINFLRNRHLPSVNNDAMLQDIYMSVSRFGLLRQRRIKI